jgi:uncharacterized protein YegJ (DUF2314 family)
VGEDVTSEMFDAVEATWWLSSGEERHAAHPTTFQLPPRRRRRMLHKGEFAKLMFEFAPRLYGGHERDGERMWVEVVESKAGHYLGTLANDPAVLTELAYGDTIEFGPEHIIDIMSPHQN